MQATEQTNVDVLIVQDDAALRRLLQDSLESDGLTVLAVSSGLQALDLLPACGAQVVLFDWTPDRMQPAELMQRLAAERLDVRVVLCSAWPEVTAVAEELGLEYVRQPFELDALCAAVRKALGTKLDAPMTR